MRLGDPVVKRSVLVAGHATSVSVEEPFWRALRAIAARRGLSLSQLVAAVDNARGAANLSSALRVFALEDLQREAQRGETAPSAASGGAQRGTGPS